MRAFRLAAGCAHARRAHLRPVDEARGTLKPEIPLIGDHGIPIRDEIVLERG